MLFHSTRGGDKNRTFEDILMQGLASDGGLFMPDFWPQVDLESLANKSSFIDIAKEIVPLFTSSSFDDEVVLSILDNTWHDFAYEDRIEIYELLEEYDKALSDYTSLIKLEIINDSTLLS